MLQKSTISRFGDIRALKGVFADVKRARGTRQSHYALIVEDDHFTRRILSSTLKDNVTLMTAQNAHEAVASYLLYAPDIVFLDIGLPDVNGFDVLKQILDCDPEAYVVMFSGDNSADNVIRSLNEGAMGFVGKPFKPEDMRRYIFSSARYHRKTSSLQNG